MDFHVIHYTQIIWEEVAFIWKVTGKAVAIFMTGRVNGRFTDTITRTRPLYALTTASYTNRSTSIITLGLSAIYCRNHIFSKGLLKK